MHIILNNPSYQEEKNITVIGNPLTWYFLWNLVISIKHYHLFFTNFTEAGPSLAMGLK